MGSTRTPVIWRDFAADRAALWRALLTQEGTVSKAAHVLQQALQSGATLFWAGNGGSAAQCQHFSAELVGRFERDREGMRSLALVGDVAAVTAIANDMGYEHLFERQLAALARRGDVLIALSTSGRSPNVLAAARWAKANGLDVVALVGRGGPLAELADVAICVPADNVALVQEAHMGVGHYLCALLEQHAAPADDRQVAV